MVGSLGLANAAGTARGGLLRDGAGEPPACSALDVSNWRCKAFGTFMEGAAGLQTTAAGAA